VSGPGRAGPGAQHHSPVSNRRQNPAVCDVYHARLSSLLPHHAGLLDETERARADRYVRAVDRDRFVLAAALLRIVARRVGNTTEAVGVDRECDHCGEPHGKPRLTGSAFEVSLSHSGEMVVVAISAQGPVGIDVEARRPLDYEPLLRYVCTEDEQRHIQGPDDFFTYWTRKEALLKARGTGLTTPLRSVSVTSPHSAPAVLTWNDRSSPKAQLFDLPLGHSFAGALAVLSTAPLRYRLMDAAHLLGPDTAAH
jgi:4'-phosphopantetheinyl transferase